MEHRLAIISSHLRPIPWLPSSASAAPCSGGESRAVGGNGEDSGSRSGGEGCVFCKIVRGELPSFKIYEDEVCLCILDSSPLNPGHSLIIPKKHFSSLEKTPPFYDMLKRKCYFELQDAYDEMYHIITAMCSTVPFLSKAIMSATESDGFNLLVNNGAAAGQVVFHTHLHIIPRRQDDKLWTSDGVKSTRLKLNKGASALTHQIIEQLSYSKKVDGFCETQASKFCENS